jgi:protein-tyrosine phosphatase
MLFSKKKNYHMFDMHCHILPGLDDGSRSMEETLQMLQIAQEEGITDMIVTPHYKKGICCASPETIHSSIEEVEKQARASGIDIRLYPGNEVYYFSDLEEDLEAQKICTMCGTDHILVEFSPTDTFTYIRNALEYVQSWGYTPILAHVERYECMVKKWENIELLRKFDIEIQVNAADITGAVGSKIKQYIKYLLQNRYVDYVGTDAHRASGSRIPAVRKCLQYLYSRYDAGYVQAITYQNAEKLVKNV